MHERPTHSRKPHTKGKSRPPTNSKRRTSVDGDVSKPQQSRDKLSRYYYATGYSCEQALFAAFADLLGVSLTKASQMAPPIRSRGKGCGAASAAVALLTRLPLQKNEVDTAGDDTAEDGEEAAAVEAFTRLFLSRFGSQDCDEIKFSQRRDCMDVIGETARMIDGIISRHGQE